MMGSLMLKIVCPHCAAPVEIFSSSWQGQRKSKKKACSSCGNGVEPVFSIKRYVLVLFAALLLSWLTVNFLGLSFKYLSWAIPLSFGVALFPSMYLQKL